MVDEKRKYELKKRAEAMAGTRQRITEAAVELHGSVGPARTSISAVAERAGVQRHTVYRHFPTEADLFAACSAHFYGTHPMPAPEPWDQIADPHERLVAALDELYLWYERTEGMNANVVRDMELVESVAVGSAAFQQYMGEVMRVLSSGRPRRKVVTAALTHALDFRTWQSLVRGGGVSRAQAVQLVAAMVESAS
jgi:AcrR family transcriptional regulator